MPRGNRKRGGEHCLGRHRKPHQRPNLCRRHGRGPVGRQSLRLRRDLWNFLREGYEAWKTQSFHRKAADSPCSEGMYPTMNRSRTKTRVLVAIVLLALAACERKGATDAEASGTSIATATVPAAPPASAKTKVRTVPVKYVPRAGGYPESEACKSCVAEAGVAQFDCDKETGNAKAGPAAGVSRKQLCTDVLDCLYATKCAASDPLDCYCGTAGDACQKGEGNGVCRNQVERALETTDYAVIAVHYSDPKLAGGVAMTRMDAARAKCGELCGSR
jgi:hypothetical protein